MADITLKNLIILLSAKPGTTNVEMARNYSVFIFISSSVFLLSFFKFRLTKLKNVSLTSSLSLYLYYL